jgi:hypothetical protein
VAAVPFSRRVARCRPIQRNACRPFAPRAGATTRDPRPALELRERDQAGAGARAAGGAARKSFDYDMIVTEQIRRRASPHSTVTDLARLRG